MSDKENETLANEGFLVPLFRWSFRLAIVLLPAYLLFSGFFEERKAKFVDQSISAAMVKCSTDKACLANTQANARDCVLNNYHQERANKRVKKYVLDEAAFYACLDA